MFKIRTTSNILFLCACVLAFLPSSTAHATDVYYSVGTNASDLKADSTVTVTGGNTATFSAAQPEDIGAGDKIVYNTSRIAYIASRISSTQFLVSDAQGASVTNGGPWAVNSITRAFNTLNNAVNVAAIPNASNSAYLDTVDLTGGPYTLYIVCYGDAAADITAATVGGWVTDAVSTIHLIRSQEFSYKGRWDAGAYRLAVSSGDALTVLDDNIHISGLQISLDGSADDGIVFAAGNDQLFVSDVIIRYAGANPPNSSGIVVDDAGQGGVSAYLWNNIVYDFLGTDNAGIRVDLSGAGSKAYVYNNTIYNNTLGIDNVAGTNTIVAKNNLAYWNGDNYGGLGTFDALSSHNLSGPNTDAQIPGVHAQDGKAVSFVDVANGDFHLAANDAAAQDGGTDLSDDANLSFMLDREGQRRGRLWDIGADERVSRALRVISDTNPIIIQLGNAAVAEDVQITFTDASGGINVLRKGGYGTAWGSDLISTGTLFTIGGESGAAVHSIAQKTAAEVVIKKVRAGIISYYHIYPSGRIVLDASGATSVTVNQTAVFPEYADGTAHAGGYHAYVDLLRTTSDASADYLSPDIPSIIAGARVTDRLADYGQDGFEEGEGDYAVMAASANATVDFDGASQARYEPVLRLEEFFPRTQASAALRVYWDAEDATISGSETWTGLLTSVLTSSTGLRGAAQENDSPDDYASLQRTSNIDDPGTLSLWIKSSSFANPSAREYLFYDGADFNLYFDTSGRLNFRIADGVDLTDTDDRYDNAWHEVTCVWDYSADTYGLYVDGKLKKSSSASYAAPAWDATIYFTAEDAAGTSRFNGLIDEARIYDALELPTGHALFYSRLDSSVDLTSPQVGNGGGVAGVISFPSGVRGNAIFFDGPGEYASLPSAGNINATAGTLELWVKTAAAGNPPSNEQLFYGAENFQLYFGAQGHVHFKIDADETLTNTQDVYDGTWHHIKALWDYNRDQYFLYVDGQQADASAGAYNAPTLDATMYMGAADEADTNRYNGSIDVLAVYDAMIFPYGAFHVPVVWGDAFGKADASVLLYWDADSNVLGLGAGEVVLGGSITTGAGVNGSAIVNGSAGDYVAFAASGNMPAREGSLGFWVKSAGAGNPSGPQYLIYADDTFNVFFDALGFLNFMVDGGTTLQYATDIYDAKWHFLRVSWDYNNDLYELFVDGVRYDYSTDAASAPVLGTAVYLTASDASGANRFDGSLDEVYITNSQATAEMSSVYGTPVLPPQAASPYAFRLEAGASLAGLADDDLFTPLSDFVSSTTNSSSTYVLQYLGNISTGASPSLSNITATQNANTGGVTVSYTGTDPDDDAVLYVPQECLYSLDSTDGTNGTWAEMATAEAIENFTSTGAALSYVWDAQSDTNVYDGTVYLKLKVRDAMGHESLPVVIPSVSVDTLVPSGLGNFQITGTATTMIVLSWNPVTEDNWLNDAHYEIWYGQNQADVQTRGGTAVQWDSGNDPNLTRRTTITTTVSGLTADTLYYFKIWAVDGFANETTVSDVSGTTAQTSTARVYRVQIDAIYDSGNDALLMTTSLLTRSGSIVSDLTNLTLTYLGVLDTAGSLLSGNLNGEADTVASSTDAIFYTTWDPASGLSANTTYTIISRVSYQGEDYSGVKAINVRELDALTEETGDVVGQTVTLTTTVNSLDSKIDIVTDKIEQHEEDQVALRDARQQQVAAVSESVGSVAQNTTVDLAETIQDTLQTETAKGIQSEIVTRETRVVSGDTIPIMYRGASGASPAITVYDPRNIIRVSNSVMREVGATGMYSYDLTFNVSWGLGDFTVLVRDPVNQSMDSVLMSVVQSSSYSSSGSTTGSATTTSDLVYSRLNNMSGDINDLLEGMTGASTVATDVSGSIGDLLATLGLAQTSGAMDAETIASIARAAETLVGTDDDAGSIASKLLGLEGMLGGIGSDASVVANMTKDSRSQAKAVRMIASKIQELIAAGDIEGAQAELENLAENLGGLKEGVEGLPGALTADSLSAEVQGAVEEVARIAAEKGLEGLIPSIEPPEPGKPANPEDIIEVRNNVSELKSLMAEVKDYLDQEINAPIVHAWFEGE